MAADHLLTVNAGSSSLKFAVFEPAADDRDPRRLLSGTVDRIGTGGATLTATDRDGDQVADQTFAARDHGGAAERLLDWLTREDAILADRPPRLVAHRIVHGGIGRQRHQRITADLLDRLHRAQTLDREHLPREIQLVEACRERFPDRPHVACLDTVFHRDLPRRARLLPIPRRFLDRGIRRLGFHGLSYAYLLDELVRQGGDAAGQGRVILAHLGSGASLAAVRAGRPVETTMGFTPTSGLVMSSRPGDLDPGLLVHVMRSESLSADLLDRFVSRECGLAGMSQVSGDMRELLAARDRGDERAAEAVELFCYRARTWVGALAVALGGLDTLVFAGGIGEHSPAVRREICRDLGFLGVSVDDERNGAAAPVISAEDARVTVRVIPTDEEVMMARIATRVLAGEGQGREARG